MYYNNIQWRLVVTMREMLRNTKETAGRSNSPMNRLPQMARILALLNIMNEWNQQMLSVLIIVRSIDKYQEKNHYHNHRFSSLLIVAAYVKSDRVHLRLTKQRWYKKNQYIIFICTYWMYRYIEPVYYNTINSYTYREK